MVGGESHVVGNGSGGRQGEDGPEGVVAANNGIIVVSVALDA